MQSYKSPEKNIIVLETASTAEASDFLPVRRKPMGCLIFRHNVIRVISAMSEYFGCPCVIKYFKFSDVHYQNRGF